MKRLLPSWVVSHTRTWSIEHDCTHPKGSHQEQLRFDLLVPKECAHNIGSLCLTLSQFYIFSPLAALLNIVVFMTMSIQNWVDYVI